MAWFVRMGNGGVVNVLSQLWLWLCQAGKLFSGELDKPGKCFYLQGLHSAKLAAFMEAKVLCLLKFNV